MDLNQQVDILISTYNGAEYLDEQLESIFFQDIHECFIQNQGLLKNGFSDLDRRKVTDILGEAGSRYRNKIYNNSFGIRKFYLLTRY